MQSIGIIKQGDAFAYYAEAENPADHTPVSGIAEKFKAQVRTLDKYLLSELAISETETPGRYVFEHEGSTQTWPTEGCIMDIEYRVTTGAKPISSPTVLIQVIEDVTHE